MIVQIEITVLGVHPWLTGSARIDEPRFWSYLIISLSCGLITDYSMPPSTLRRELVEHYEMLRNGTLIAWAKALNH